MNTFAIDKILIVGAGISGSTIAKFVYPHATQIEVWEKSRGAGGRMSTSRNPNNGNSTVDVGAQYISATSTEYSLHKSQYEELLGQNVLEPLQGTLEGDKRPKDGTFDFVAPSGVSHIAEYFLQKSGATVSFNRRAASVCEASGRWAVTSECGNVEHADALILTMPTPQILQLHGDICNLIDKDIKSKLEAVQYSSRFAVGLFYEPGTHLDLPWCAKYIDDEIVRFVSIDSRKRGKEGADSAPSVVVHTSVPFGLKHLEEEAETVCTRHVIPRLRELVPELPDPVHVEPHKWRYSQVSRPYEGQPGALVLREKPLLICAGDAFTRSGFNGCLESALKVTELVNKLAD